ncbi:MAG TPA: AraC family transcriptional regulator [Pseudomonas sp.]|uniref:AraC family transcriptional regulator n=1 Tax=Pseudomonas sp. TaxID=306 RepID=UPI002EDAEFAA
MNASNSSMAHGADPFDAAHAAHLPNAQQLALLSSALDALMQARPDQGIDLNSDVENLVSASEGEGGFGAALVDPLMYQLIRSLLPALRSRQGTHQDSVEQAMLALCAHLSQRFEPNQPSRPAERVALSPWQERRAKELMNSHMDQGLSIARIASECSLSRSHFSRAFKKNTGVSPRDWFLQVRLDKAKGLLTDSALTISQISLDCGFADQSHFTRVFTRTVGVTPFTWRRSMPAASVRRVG